jgi:ATP-dependent NAD(P)H-hydrate dehydratase
LYLVQNHPEIIKGYSNAILTPNLAEFKRLCERMVNGKILTCDETTKNSNCFFYYQKINFEDSNKDNMVGLLSQAFGGVTIVQKGQYDLISNGNEGIAYAKCSFFFNVFFIII